MDTQHIRMMKMAKKLGSLDPVQLMALQAGRSKKNDEKYNKFIKLKQKILDFIKN